MAPNLVPAAPFWMGSTPVLRRQCVCVPGRVSVGSPGCVSGLCLLSTATGKWTTYPSVTADPLTAGLESRCSPAQLLSKCMGAAHLLSSHSFQVWAELGLLGSLLHGAAHCRLPTWLPLPCNGPPCLCEPMACLYVELRIDLCWTS